ncbi:MAG: hypothetical protein R3Y33_06105, partial [Clostridia bacterium]
MKKLISTALLLSILCLSFAGCSEPSATSSTDSSSSSSSEISTTTQDDDFSTSVTIQGIGDEDIVFTMEEIKAFEPVETTAQSTTSNGEINVLNIKGTYVKDLLESKGYDISDFESMKIVSNDGYEIIVPTDVLSSRDVILAYEEDGEEYDEYGAFRSVIPDERAMYWVKGVSYLNFEANIASSNIEHLVFLDNIADFMDLEDYDYYGLTEQAVKISDLFENFAVIDDETSGSIVASDGLEDDKDIDTLNDGYLKLTGEDAPLFLAPDMPKGMQIKEIVYLKTGDTCFVTVSVSGETDLQSILSGSGINSTSYIAVDISGEETELDGGILSTMEFVTEDDTLYLV